MQVQAIKLGLITAPVTTVQVIQVALVVVLVEQVN
jgi:hypothetical protein